MGERPINAGRDGVAMGVDSVGGKKQKTRHSVYGQSDKRHVKNRNKGCHNVTCNGLASRKVFGGELF